MAVQENCSLSDSASLLASSTREWNAEFVEFYRICNMANFSSGFEFVVYLFLCVFHSCYDVAPAVRPSATAPGSGATASCSTCPALQHWFPAEANSKATLPQRLC